MTNVSRDTYRCRNQPTQVSFITQVARTINIIPAQSRVWQLRLENMIVTYVRYFVCTKWYRPVQPYTNEVCSQADDFVR